jgi:hypothetical protein
MGGLHSTPKMIGNNGKPEYSHRVIDLRALSRRTPGSEFLHVKDHIIKIGKLEEQPEQGNKVKDQEDPKSRNDEIGNSEMLVLRRFSFDPE